MVTVSGYLDRVVERGGETPGWVLDLDRGLTLDKGEEVSRIEVEPGDGVINLNAFSHKFVEVTGILEWRSGIERGDYHVIVINTIKEMK